VAVPESWREALRLLVADCKDDDVDEVLLSILNPLQGEDAEKTRRPRAVSAALCLADEPNVSEESAQQVLTAFASAVRSRDGGGGRRTTLDSAAIEVGRSMWSQGLKENLMEEYCHRSPQTRMNPGGLWGMVEVAGWARSGLKPTTGCGALVERLQSGDRVEVLSAALVAMVAAFEAVAVNVPGLTERLLMLLEQERPESSAAAWALVWMTGWRTERNSIWLPSEAELEVVVRALSRAPDDEALLKRCLIGILGKVSNKKSLGAIISKLDDPDDAVRSAVVQALGQLGDKEAVPPLLAKLEDPDDAIRSAVVQALGQLGDKEVVPPLLAKLEDPDDDVRSAVVRALGQLGDKEAVPPLLAKLEHPDAGVRRAVVEALGELGDKEAVPTLVGKLDDPNADVRRAVVEELVRMRNNETERILLSRDLDGAVPWMDPKEPITEKRLEDAAARLGITRQEVRSLYASLAADFHLRFA
jgi:hypothetical protein